VKLKNNYTRLIATFAQIVGVVFVGRWSFRTSLFRNGVLESASVYVPHEHGK
jgi:hypothetical protein